MPGDILSTNPRELGGDEARLLQALWDVLDRAGHWPSYATIDRTFLSKYDHVDLPKLINRIPTSILRGGRPAGGARAQPDGQLSLTVLGAAAYSGTEQVLQVVVVAARLAAAAWRWGDPAKPVEVTFDQVVEELDLDLPEAEEKKLGTQSSWLLSDEPWTTNSWTGEGRWRFNVDRDIAKYDDVDTFEEYWRTRERHLEALHASDSTPQPSLGSFVASGPVSVVLSTQGETGAAPEVASEGPLVFLGLVLAPLLAVLAVIQSTSSVAAQIIGTVLAAVMMVVIFVCLARWARQRSRYTLLAVLLLLGAGVAVVVIAGNATP
jgi:hypothetical protein